MSQKDKKRLSPKQQLFVSEYLLDGNATRAAAAAGYSAKNAKSAGYHLLTKRENVKSEIEAARKQLRQASAYNAEKAMSEAEEAMRFAKETENANAYIKSVELRAKLTGLLIERHDVRQLARLEIKITGIDTDSNEGK